MVVWSDPAKADLRAIHDYVALNSKHYARKVTQEIIDKTEPLDGLPRMGRKVAELGMNQSEKYRSTRIEFSMKFAAKPSSY